MRIKLKTQNCVVLDNHIREPNFIFSADKKNEGTKRKVEETMKKLARQWRKSAEDELSLPTRDDNLPMDTQGWFLSRTVSASISMFGCREMFR